MLKAGKPETVDTTPIGTGPFAFTGYVLDKKVAMRELHVKEDNKVSLGFFKVWLFLLRYILPIIIAIVCLAQFF